MRAARYAMRGTRLQIEYEQARRRKAMSSPMRLALAVLSAAPSQFIIAIFNNDFVADRKNFNYDL
jgi:hypothetical protein